MPEVTGPRRIFLVVPTNAKPTPQLMPALDRYMTGNVLELSEPHGHEVAVRDGDGWRWEPVDDA